MIQTFLSRYFKEEEMNKKIIFAIATAAFALTNFLGTTYASTKTEVSINNISAHEGIKNDLRNVKWLEKHSKAIKTTIPTDSIQDLKPLNEMVGSASIVGLGEATHGAHEIFTMKHRIVNYLVSEKGFSNIVLEDNWDNALMLDKYVLTGKGDPSKYLNPVLNTKEIVNMLKWIKNYNADPNHKKKIRIIGMDIQTVNKGVYEKIKRYVKKYSPDLVPSLEEKLNGLMLVTKDLNTFSSLQKEEKEKYISDGKQISTLLEQNKSKLNGNSKEFAWIQQHARIIEQFTTMTTEMLENPSEFYLKHDIAMYENAKWTEEHLGKTIVWAHNGHISKTNMLPFVYPKMSGQHLVEHYGKRYVTIGTSVYKGKYNVYNTNDEYGPYGELDTKDSNSYNYTLGKVKKDQYLIDLRKANGSVKAWLNEQHPIFAGITTVGPGFPSTVDIKLDQTFDILVQIQNVSPTQINK